MLSAPQDAQGARGRALRERIGSLLDTRRSRYESAAVRVSTTSRTPSATVRLIVAKLRRLDD
jgi:hypothetical protein